jgi:hypothetical protein
MRSLLTYCTDFNNPQGALLGIINAAFSIGAVLALPIVPYVCTSLIFSSRRSGRGQP